MNNKSLSIVVPALNERPNLGPTVERLQRALAEASIVDYEIIIINDGSTDGTGEVARDLAGRYKQIQAFDNAENQGLGASYVQGIGRASRNYFVYIPADNTWPLESFVALFKNMAGADIITSYASNPEVRPWGRRSVSKLYTKTLNFLFHKKMNYFNGLTIYPMTYLRSTRIASHGFAFQAELLMKALFQGFSYIELKLPIDERTAGFSKAVNLKNIMNVITTVIRLFFELQVSRRIQNKIASVPD